MKTFARFAPEITLKNLKTFIGDDDSRLGYCRALLAWHITVLNLPRFEQFQKSELRRVILLGTIVTEKVYGRLMADSCPANQVRPFLLAMNNGIDYPADDIIESFMEKVLTDGKGKVLQAVLEYYLYSCPRHEELQPLVNQALARHVAQMPQKAVVKL